jgi:hypothetical protein
MINTPDQKRNNRIPHGNFSICHSFTKLQDAADAGGGIFDDYFIAISLCV